MGEIATWDHAESQLKSALDHANMAHTINEKDGAFYGPKIDFDITDAIGRNWQCATIQLDYAQPENFDLKYVGADNTEHRPVVIHRAIFGSFERFIAILIEHYAGAFPVWLAPVQAMVIPIAVDEETPVSEATGCTKTLRNAPKTTATATKTISTTSKTPKGRFVFDKAIIASFEKENILARPQGLRPNPRKRVRPLEDSEATRNGGLEKAREP